MRNMSFALTKPQMLARTKTVTRRLGWEFVKVGELLQPVEKCMGLKPGEHIVKIGAPILVVDKWRERLDKICDAPDYGWQECEREGFPELTPDEFIVMFVRSHRGCTPVSAVTRIQFEFTEAP